MKATDVLIQCLENEGVEYIFGIVGKETLDLVESISRSEQIQFVPVRHEQGAAFMANVYGKLANKTGVCTATLGPGATNLLTGIASALLDHSPLLAITGQAGSERQHKQSHQLIDVVNMMEPATKWASQIKDPKTIPEMIRKSFRIANTERPGPVLIELPENLAVEDVPPRVLPVIPIPTRIPDDRSIQTAADVIKQSTKPFVIVGDGVIRDTASKELLDFVEKLGAPVTHSFMAKGILPKHHPQNFYTFGFEENDIVLSGIEEADLLIVIGFDFIEKLPKDWNRTKVPVLHINALPAEMDEYYPVQAELVGILKITLQTLNTLDLPSKHWLPSGNLKNRIEQSHHIFQDEKDTAHLPLTTEHILQVIEKLSSDKTIIISDVGAHKISIARTYQPKQPGGLVISNGFASMGIAIPGAIGAKLARPNNPVICISGDGGALMTFSEIETATRLGLSLIIIVLNNHVLELERQMMNKKFYKSFGVKFGNPDFALLAESFGVKGVRPQTLEEFEVLLKQELESQTGIVLFDIPLQQTT
ncbi:acetolactate synthase large subunit [Lederbergia citrea]|uniref:acetolactate synthase large subunit n=1 Tax=Lederbergia citrea TaxID=2833581 RepID=UPI001BC98EE5|nr:acetolactate synthase large subunit [Lederbergia citrea]MBS4177942.1 acetolactate synthase large subunit [Lederbergia citrea]